MSVKTPICNVCKNTSVISHANFESFFYCKTCKVEIDDNGNDVNIPLVISLKSEDLEEVSSKKTLDSMTDEEYDQFLTSYTGFI